jgi:hypothetical protein
LGSFRSNSIELFAKFAPIKAQRYRLRISFSPFLRQISSKIAKDLEESEPKTQVKNLGLLWVADIQK